MMNTIAMIRDIFEIIAIACFLIVLYLKYKKPKMKVVQSDSQKQAKKQKKHLKLCLPFMGKAKIIQYNDKKHGYIESAWNEIEKPKK